MKLQKGESEATDPLETFSSSGISGITQTVGEKCVVGCSVESQRGCCTKNLLVITVTLIQRLVCNCLATTWQPLVSKKFVFPPGNYVLRPVPGSQYHKPNCKMEFLYALKNYRVCRHCFVFGFLGCFFFQTRTQRSDQA